MNKKLILNDILLLVAIALLLVISALFIYKPAESDYITVKYDNKFVKQYSLNEDITEEICDSGVVLEIKGERAYIKKSDCPDKICVNSPAITKSSPAWAGIVCLPGKVSVTKGAGTEARGADTIAG